MDIDAAERNEPPHHKHVEFDTSQDGEQQAQQYGEGTQNDGYGDYDSYDQNEFWGVESVGKGKGKSGGKGYKLAR